MLAGGHPGNLEKCPGEWVASVFNSRLNCCTESRVLKFQQLSSRIGLLVRKR